MKIEFIGNKNLSKILFIYPLGFDKSILQSFIKKLETDYFLCMVYLDEDLEKVSYKSAKNQAIKIENELINLSIIKFKLLFSLSLSGLTAMQLYFNDIIKFENCILDGVPMLNLGFLKEKLIFSLIMEEKNNINFDFSIKNNKLNKYLNSNVTALIKTTKNMTEPSIKLMLSDALRFNFQKLSKEKQEHLHIRYGEHDFACKSINDLKKIYTKSNLYIKKNCMHCQEIIDYTDNYISFIKKVINDI